MSSTASARVATRTQTATGSSTADLDVRQKTLWSIATLAVIIYALVPVLWMVSLSLKKGSAVASGHLIPRSNEITFDNYKNIFTSGAFNRALVNSIGICLISTLLAIILASMCAYALVRLEFRGKSVILTGALAIAMFPPISIVGSLFNLWRQVGLFDTWQGLIIPYMTFSLPLAIYTLSAFFREIPWDLEKAAQMDRATPFQAFRQVIVPLAAPGVFTAAIIVFITAWNDFLYATVLTSTDKSRTVPAALAFFTGGSQFVDPVPAIAAAAVVITIPVIIMVLLFQRRIVSGLTAGAVKG
jgi:multiple sugar transport system permease protein